MVLKSIKNQLLNRVIRSKPYPDTHLRKLIPYESIKSMAFLIDGSDHIALRLLLNRLSKYRSDGKRVSFFGYVKKFPPFEDEGILWLTKKDLNWIGTPKSSQIKKIWKIKTGKTCS